ncbi:hypothetical protein SAMN04488589_1494 [Methanolobus vulcani]|uniref:Uncharacterized protein n=1 Tax=Methanolobus vulcani TaxID=38026 RepID=A0A7Z7FCJ3_9EURY|nr:hypothetical protein [Methanolobus vulcani]SDF84336.1 hypothetical protein SAMN04488589_1494 [Methanolobus vulcani]
MRIIDDDSGFSTSIDAILFLVLVSVSAVILFPSIAADEQYRSASYSSAQDMDTQLMNTIMSSTLEEFEYTVKPAELAGIDVNLSEDSILGNAEDTLFAKEQQHRTFSDLVAEGLVLGLVMEKNGTEKPLNPMTKMQRIETEKAIEEHLKRTIGQRYNYRFEAHWQPVSGYNIHSDIVVGETAPLDAIKQKARISVPVTYTVTRDEICQPFNESNIYASVNSPDADKELHNMFNSSIITASEGASDIITDIVFPYEYLSSLNGTEISIDSEQLACIAGPDNANYSSPIIKSALGCVNYTVKDLYGLNVELTTEEQSISLDFVNMAHDLIKEKNTNLISEHIFASQSDDIDQTVALICNASDNSSRIELADTQLSKIYRTANPGGADIIIMIW